MGAVVGPSRRIRPAPGDRRSLERLRSGLGAGWTPRRDGHQRASPVRHVRSSTSRRSPRASRQRSSRTPVPRSFSAESWSPDGTLIAGSMLDSAGAPRTAGVLDVATGRVRVIDVPGPKYQVRIGRRGLAAGLAEVPVRVGDRTRAGRLLDRHLDAGASAVDWQATATGSRRTGAR